MTTMKRTYNTPTPYAGLPPSKPALAGKELLHKLEDDYQDYRHSCNSNNGYCKSDPTIHADFKRRIADAVGSA